MADNNIPAVIDTAEALDGGVQDHLGGGDGAGLGPGMGGENDGVAGLLRGCQGCQYAAHPSGQDGRGRDRHGRSTAKILLYCTDQSKKQTKIHKISEEMPEVHFRPGTFTGWTA